jgi:hypothetical protein
VRKPAGRCPRCGAEVAAYVVRERDREERIERIAAVVSTILVLVVLVGFGGLGLLEGIAGYALAGAVVWVVAQKTFWSKPRATAGDG